MTICNEDVPRNNMTSVPTFLNRPLNPFKCSSLPPPSDLPFWLYFAFMPLSGQIFCLAGGGGEGEELAAWWLCVWIVGWMIGLVLVLGRRYEGAWSILLYSPLRPPSFFSLPTRVHRHPVNEAVCMFSSLTVKPVGWSRGWWRRRRGWSVRKGRKREEGEEGGEEGERGEGGEGGEEVEEKEKWKEEEGVEGGEGGEEW